MHCESGGSGGIIEEGWQRTVHTLEVPRTKQPIFALPSSYTNLLKGSPDFIVDTFKLLVVLEVAGMLETEICVLNIGC